MLLQEGVGLQGEPPVAGVGIGQHRAVGIGSGLGAAQIVIGEGNGVAVAYKLFAGCTLVDANRDSPAKEIIQTCHYR